MRSIGLVLAILGGIVIYLGVQGKAGRAFLALLNPEADNVIDGRVIPKRNALQNQDRKGT